MMESRQTRLDDVTLVSRSARIPSLSSSVRDIFDIATSPRVVWSAPDETTVLGSGAAATIVATGSDRFESVRDAAESLFSTGDVHAGSEVARPRLFGGFAFHAERADSKPWKQFPNAQFIFPRVQITWSTDTHTETDTADNDSHAWITVNAVDPGATPDAVEYRLSQEIERVKTLESTNNSRSPPGVTCRHRRTSRDAWNRGVTAAINRISADNLAMKKMFMNTNLLLRQFVNNFRRMQLLSQVILDAFANWRPFNICGRQSPRLLKSINMHFHSLKHYIQHRR